MKQIVDRGEEEVDDRIDAIGRKQVDQAPVSITLVQPTAVDTPYPQHAKN